MLQWKPDPTFYPSPRLAMQGLPEKLAYVAAVALHSAGHLLVALLIALLVYEKIGLGLLSHAWFNLDLLSMIALMLSGALILLV